VEHSGKYFPKVTSKFRKNKNPPIAIGRTKDVIFSVATYRIKKKPDIAVRLLKSSLSCSDSYRENQGYYIVNLYLSSKNKKDLTLL
jgi:hypothetical protein